MAASAEKEQQGKEAKSPSSSTSSSSSTPPPPPPPPPPFFTFPSSSLLGPLSDSSLALGAAARERALARDAWQLDEEDAAAASEALACDACRAAVARGWELGAAWVALQGRAEAQKKQQSNNSAANAPAAAPAAGGGSPPPLPQQAETETETVFLLPAQLRQRLRRGLRAWCEREGEQGRPNTGGRAGGAAAPQISQGSALEGAKLVREQQEGGRWRRVERPMPQTTTTAVAAAAAATMTTSARERLAARLSCSSLLFSPSVPPPAALSAVAMIPGTKEQQQQQQQQLDPPVIAALADGLTLFASALSRAANSDEARWSNSKDKNSPPSPPRLPPTLLPGRRPDENGRLCADFHPECAGWASLGECEANPGYMLGDDDKTFFSEEEDSLTSEDAAFSSSSSSSGGGKGKGSSSSSSSSSAKSRRRPGFCRFSCGVCSPLPRGFPSSSSLSALAAAARLPSGAESREAAALGAEALAIREGVLLRACYAAKPCGGRGGGEGRFGKWWLSDEDERGGEEEQGGANNTTTNNNATLPSSSSSSPSPSPSPLHKRCFVSAAGWWLYEVCVGGGIRQFHPPTSPRDAPATNSLGAFLSSSDDSHSSASSDADPSSSGAAPPPPRQKVKWLSAPELYRGAPLREEAAVDGESQVFPFVEQRYEGGDPCGESEEEEQRATAVRRSATLRLVCPRSPHAAAKDIDSVPRLLVAEPETCVYVLTLFHPEACALVDETGGGGGGGGAAAAAAAKKVEHGAASVSAETTTTTTVTAAATENVAAAAAAPPEGAAAVVPAVPLPSPAVPLPSPAAAAAAHDEL